MADTTVIDDYPKATFTRDQVDAIRTDRLAHGAKSCVLSDDDKNWILTTVWPG